MHSIGIYPLAKHQAHYILSTHSTGLPLYVTFPIRHCLGMNLNYSSIISRFWPCSHPFFVAISSIRITSYFVIVLSLFLMPFHIISDSHCSLTICRVNNLTSVFSKSGPSSVSLQTQGQSPSPCPGNRNQYDIVYASTLYRTLMN